MKLQRGDVVTFESNEGGPFDATVLHSYGYAELFAIVRTSETGQPEQAVVACHPNGGWWLVRDFSTGDS